MTKESRYGCLECCIDHDIYPLFYQYPFLMWLGIRLYMLWTRQPVPFFFGKAISTKRSQLFSRSVTKKKPWNRKEFHTNVLKRVFQFFTTCIGLSFFFNL